MPGFPRRLHLLSNLLGWNAGVPTDCIFSAICWGGYASPQQFVGVALLEEIGHQTRGQRRAGLERRHGGEQTRPPLGQALRGR